MTTTSPSVAVHSNPAPEPEIAKAKSPGPSRKLLEYVQSTDARTDAECFDPYKLFVAHCRKFHGHRTKRGHSFHAKKLRWLWFCSRGNQRPFPALWTKPAPKLHFDGPRRKRNDELAITVRCLAGGFTEAETEAVIKAWGEHNGEGYDFMAMLVYRGGTLSQAKKYSESIRKRQEAERNQKKWTKTASRILWALDKRFDAAGAKPQQIAAVIERDVQAVKQRLKRLCRDGEVLRLRRGVYGLPAKQPVTTPPVAQSTPGAK